MATRHSTRRRPSGRARSNSKSRPTTAVPAKKQAVTAWKKQARSVAGAAPKKKTTAAGPPDLDEILGRFGEALALAETAYAVLDDLQQDWTGAIARRGCPAVHTLDHGLTALGRVHSEVDTAFMALSRGRRHG